MNSKADKFILIKLFGKRIVFRVNDLEPQFLSYLTYGLGCKKRILRPVKNIALCEKCKYRGKHCKAHSKCNNCEMFDKQNNCKCLSIKPGQACPYFVRADKEEPPNFFVIKAGGAVTVSGTIKEDLKTKMNLEGAIKRIKNHIEVHSRKEPHFAIRITEALKMAIAALEKQIPKKPILKETKCFDGSTDDFVFVCPICNRTICIEPEDDVIASYIKEEYPHCHCGQALDWSDTE